MSRRRKVERETPEYAGMLQRMCRAYGRRVAQADVEDLAEMAGVLEALQEAIQVAVDGQRAAGASWADIGRAFGITKQSAHGRFGGGREDEVLRASV